MRRTRRCWLSHADARESSAHAPASPVAERAYPELCVALAAGDDSMECLAIARAAIEARLARLSPGSRLRPLTLRTWHGIPGDGVGTGGVPDCAVGRAGIGFVLPWLAGEGTELRRISQAATADREPQALLFGLYTRCYGPGGGSDALQRLAESAAFPESLGTSGDPDEAAEALWEALFLRLALSCFPGRLFPEILGYALAELRGAAVWGDRSGAGLGSGCGEFACLAARAALLRAERPIIAAAVKCARRGLRGADRRGLRVRIGRGIALHDALRAQVWQAFEVHAQHPATGPAVLQRVLRRKAAYAVGYHRQVMIAGRSLDAWFAEQPFRVEAFLSALASSPWVNREVPGQSPLLQLFGFDGPMYGILTPGEEAAMRVWLDSLAAASSSSPAASALSEAPASVGPRTVPDSAPRRRAARRSRSADDGQGRFASRRGLFHALLNIEDQPGVLAASGRYVDRCLRRVAYDARHRWSRLSYTETAFDAWVEGRYQAQLSGGRPSGATPKVSRAAYVYGIEQLAPAILVDGCWLQRVDTLAAVSPPVARRLATIYADELGNGVITRNHAWIYRRLLDSLGLECPPVESAAFAANPRLLDAAFDLPVLLLSISLHTHRFLPELLGLNLAIEISGLGVAYAQAARDLEYWGIDAQIVRLHQSIDNLASGHAALAKEAILLHLRQIRGLGGEVAVQRHWRRVQQGHDLLRVVTRAFKWRLVGSYLAGSTAARLRRWTVGADAGCP